VYHRDELGFGDLFVAVALAEEDEQLESPARSAAVRIRCLREFIAADDDVLGQAFEQFG
jgi:hypothetical protein